MKRNLEDGSLYSSASKIMTKNKTILALIPARGGSKGIPKKNIKPLLGKPLIAWTIEHAKTSKYIDRIIVSTDSEEIAEISEKYGAEVPFLRPKELARDDSPTSDAIIHALNWVPQLKNWLRDPDYIFYLGTVR